MGLLGPLGGGQVLEEEPQDGDDLVIGCEDRSLLQSWGRQV